MQSGLALLQCLDDNDLSWIFAVSNQFTVQAGTVLLRENEPGTSLYLVMQGLFSVSMAAIGDRTVAVAMIGPGEVVGEMSFLERQQHSATVTAVEDSTVMQLPFAVLDDRLDRNAEFAATWYRAVAQILARRLRNMLVPVQRDAAMSSPATGWDRIATAMERFKNFIVTVDQDARRSDSQIPEDVALRVEHEFLNFSLLLEEILGERSSLSEALRKELGRQVLEDLLPYVLLTETAERCYSKPRGYAGDFETIERIYRNQPSGRGRLGPLLDRCFLNLPAGHAVRNRRHLLRDEIVRAVQASSNGTIEVVSLACGPAEEIFDAFASIQDPDRLRAHLVDFDLRALATVADRRDRMRLHKRIQLLNQNLIYLALGREEMKVPPLDLAYSIGLVDYLEDTLVVKLLGYIHAALKPGGRVILGNFHCKNPARAMMDHVLEWRLIHRTEDDMHRLFQNSAFGKRCAEIRFEEQGINMFAVANK